MDTLIETSDNKSTQFLGQNDVLFFNDLRKMLLLLIVTSLEVWGSLNVYDVNEFPQKIFRQHIS